MGNDANKRRIDGIIDNVVFDTVPATPAEIGKLTCLPQPSLMSVTPVDPAAVPPGTPVDYDVEFTNNSCEDAPFQFNAFSFSFDPGIIVNPNFGFSFVPAPSTAHLPFTVSAALDIEQFGTSQIGVNAQLFSSNVESSQVVNSRSLQPTPARQPLDSWNPESGLSTTLSAPPWRRVDSSAHGEHGTDSAAPPRCRGHAVVVPPSAVVNLHLARAPSRSEVLDSCGPDGISTLAQSSVCSDVTA